MRKNEVISFEEAKIAKIKLKEEIFGDSNVVSMGIIEDVNNLGEKTGGYAIKIGIISAEVYRSSLNYGEKSIPREYAFCHEASNKNMKYVRIKLVETGLVKALSVFNPPQSKDFPSAIDNIPFATTMALSGPKSRQRPCPGGQSIGHYKITAGTLGLLVGHKNGPNKGKAYILSNNHVMANNNLAYVGDPILQPGPADCGVVDKDTIASLYRWVPFKSIGTNFVDAAIAELKGEKNWQPYVKSYVSNIGQPCDFTDAAIGMYVEKTGRTTGHTTGTIISVDESIKIYYGKQVGFLEFDDQITTNNMSEGGDSGSCLFQSGTRKPVGLLFAGDTSETFYNHINKVLLELSKRHTNKYSSGETHTFEATPLLSILGESSLPYSASLFPRKRIRISHMRGLRRSRSVKPGTPFLFSIALLCVASLLNNSKTSKVSVKAQGLGRF